MVTARCEICRARAPETWGETYDQGIAPAHRRQRLPAGIQSLANHQNDGRDDQQKRGDGRVGQDGIDGNPPSSKTGKYGRNRSQPRYTNQARAFRRFLTVACDAIRSPLLWRSATNHF